MPIGEAFIDDALMTNNEGQINLLSEWDNLQQYFSNALADIADATNQRIKSQLENWYEVLKKVMRMHAVTSD